MRSIIVIVALFLGMASAAVWIENNPVKPKEFENKTGCYIQEINDVIPYGETIAPIGHCVRIHCGGQIDYASCGVVFTSDEKCHVTETDYSKPYPECCPDIECDEDNEIK